MSRPEPRQQGDSPAIEALLNYLVDTGETPESYGGVRFRDAEQKRKSREIGMAEAGRSLAVTTDVLEALLHSLKIDLPQA